MVTPGFQFQGFGRGNIPFPQSMLDEDPDIAFETFIRQGRGRGRNRGDERFLRGRQGEIYNDWKAFLGGEISQGRIPTTSYFWDWLPENVGGGGSDYLRRFNPSDRGQSQRGYNPRANFNFRLPR